MMSKQHGVDRATQALYESKHVYTKKKTHPLKRFVEVFLLCVFFKDSLPNSWCYIKSSEPLDPNDCRCRRGHRCDLCGSPTSYWAAKWLFL